MKLDIKVKDVYSKNFLSVSKDDTLSYCLSMFKAKMPPVLAVVDKEGNYEGVLARRWIMRSKKLDPSATKVETLMRPAPVVREEESVGKAASLMIESSIRELPVFNGDKLVGVVTDEDIIHGAVMTEWGNIKIEEIMTEKPFVVEDDDSVGNVLSLFRTQDISHAPVVKKGKPVGMVSIQDIIDNFFQPTKRQKVGERIGEKIDLLGAPVKNIMSKPLISVSPETSLRDAEKKMHDFGVSSLVILKKGKIVGIVVKRDFLEPVAEPEMEKPMLTVQFSVKDLNIDEAQRDLMMKDFDSFRKRYETALELGTLFTHIKTHGTNFKGDPLVYCRINLRTVKGSFSSSAEGWGPVETFRIALDRVEKQVLKSKSLEDSKFARNFLRLIRFPETDF
ncbi:MAG: CBS domain-containing protein [Candidatus Jordarchaeum sp.]|uniref:CBS domain-containing protein n=1 Tax=Candidatus Jordarchaeum sp. TaxID=2823881 RepID=UPI00404B649E